MNSNSYRRRSVTSPASSVTSASSQRRRSSVSSVTQPNLQFQRQPQAQPSSSRRRNSRQHQQPAGDGLNAISESDKPTLELAAFASDEFLSAMRQAAAEKFTVVPSRQLPPHMRRMSEPPAPFGLSLGHRGRHRDRRHSVDAITDGPAVAFLSKKGHFGSSESGQLSSFAELDEADPAEELEAEIEGSAAASEAAQLTARSLLRSPPPPPSRSSSRQEKKPRGQQPQLLTSLRSQRRKVSIDSAVCVH